MNQSTCPFCTLAPARILVATDLGVVVRDGFPVSPGHTLIIPRRHVGSFFDLTSEEHDAIVVLLHTAKEGVDAEFKPDGYNIGFNDGPAAGQTVPHLHVHLIPRISIDYTHPQSLNDERLSPRGQNSSRTGGQNSMRADSAQGAG